MNDMISKILEIEIVKGYCENTETIQELKNNFYKTLKLKEDTEKNYKNLISDYGLKLALLSNFTLLKKLKTNKEDGLVLVEMIKDVTNDLENLFKGDM